MYCFFQENDIKLAIGGPDPTAGGGANEQASWYLDGKNLKDNIKKILIKFCVPAPIVFRFVHNIALHNGENDSHKRQFLALGVRSQS